MRESFSAMSAVFLAIASASGAVERDLQYFNQQLVVERFAQESQCPGRKRLLAQLGLLVRGDKNHRDPMAAPRQLFLHLQAVQARHLDIQHDTVDPQRRHRFDEVDKLTPGRKRIRIHPERADKTLQRSTDRLVVIDNSDQWFLFRDNPLTQHRAGNKDTYHSTPGVVREL